MTSHIAVKFGGIRDPVKMAYFRVKLDVTSLNMDTFIRGGYIGCEDPQEVSVTKEKLEKTWANCPDTGVSVTVVHKIENKKGRNRPSKNVVSK